MTYYVFKVLWLIAAPTSALVLISATAALVLPPADSPTIAYER
jgi:hypothetical protein